MTDLGSAARVALAVIDAEDLGCALVGGFAVSVRSEPRFTRDLDLVVAVPDDDAAEALVRRLVSEGHEVLATVEQEAVGRLAMVRVRLAEGGDLDLLFASSGVEGEVVAAAEPMEVLPGLSLRVAGVGDLIALKLLSQAEDRPTDAADLLALLGVADASDLARAETLVALIEERGFARNRDLRAALGRLRRPPSG